MSSATSPIRKYFLPSGNEKEGSCAGAEVTSSSSASSSISGDSASSGRMGVLGASSQRESSRDESSGESSRSPSRMNLIASFCDGSGRSKGGFDSIGASPLTGP